MSNTESKARHAERREQDAKHKRDKARAARWQAMRERREVRRHAGS